MKRLLIWAVLTMTFVFCMAGAAVAEENLRDVHCEEQEFSTKIPADLTAYWEEGNGLRISVEDPGYVPFVLVWRKGSSPTDGAEHLSNDYTQHMREQYGNDLIGEVQYEYYDIGGKKLPAALFTYKVDGGTLCLLRLEEVRDDQTTVQYTAKYVNGDPDATLAALDTAVRYYRPDDEPIFGQGSKDTDPVPGSDDGGQKAPGSAPGTENGPASGPASDRKAAFDVILSPSSQVAYQTYTDPSGYFTMEIPRGWQVTTGLKPSGLVDLISYAICLSDPGSPDRMLYFNLNCSGILKSEEARQWYMNNYPSGPFAQSPVATEVSVKGFFEGMAGLYDYTSFRVKEYAGTNVLGGDVLRADVTSSLTGSTAEGLFSAVLMDSPYMVQKNPFNYTEGMVDAGLLTMFDVIMETALEGEFLNWQPVLEHCLSSISFSEAFMTQRGEAWRQVMGTSQVIMQTGSEISDMIMDAWEGSGRTGDILSQKQSDAALGYERVYDTETGEYLKAEDGFTDWYTGTRYQGVDTDEAYLSPVSGTIMWK